MAAGYQDDAVYRTVQWIRGEATADTPFAATFEQHWITAGGAGRVGTVRTGLVNYKPFERARVMTEVELLDTGSTSSRTLSIFIHVFADVSGVERESARASLQPALPGSGPAHFAWLERCSSVWVLPNAPNLRELHDLLDAERFQEVLAKAPPFSAHGAAATPPRLLRYVPMKRAVLQWHEPSSGRCHYLKLFDGAEAEAIVRHHITIADAADRAGLAVAVPRPEHFDAARHLLFMSEVPGRRFTELMREGNAAAFSAVGRALASLHESGARAEAVWTMKAEAEELRRNMHGAARALPSLAARLDALVDRLQSDMPVPAAPDAPIHGNLFGDQILYDDGAAQPVGLVDWDRFSRGDPHYDIGRLLAHFAFLVLVHGMRHDTWHGCSHALLAGYQSATKRPGLDAEILQRQFTMALLLRAKISLLRPLVPDWPLHFARVVEAAESALTAPAHRMFNLTKVSMP